MGGGTGLIGDPSGKEAERQLRTHKEIEQNIAGQKPIFERVLDFDPKKKNAAIVVNNLDWLSGLGYLEALRDVGKHFSVNMMIQKESVKERLHHREQGISYTEFSYMILQAYDFLKLYEDHAVTVQVGGSDQWGNIVAGCDLIRRTVSLKALSVREGSPACHKTGETPVPPNRSTFEGETGVLAAECFGLTAPLVTKSDGGKFGKTETGAVWLTAVRTSPYAFYQYWLNVSDDDAQRYLKLFTLLKRNEIDEIIGAHKSDPGARGAQRAVADAVTRLVHGDAAADRAQVATRALFTGEVASLDKETLDEVFADVESSEHRLSELAGEGLPLVELLPTTSLAKSKREAREFLTHGAISVNGAKVGINAKLTASDLLHGSIALLRRGKKSWYVTLWT